MPKKIKKASKKLIIPYSVSTLFRIHFKQCVRNNFQMYLTNINDFLNCVLTLKNIYITDKTKALTALFLFAFESLF